MAPGGLIGIPPGGPSVSDPRSGNHHTAYYGHQANSNQYYGAHVHQKYPEPIIHPGQHQLQLGGPLANDSPPPLSTASGHEGQQNRLQTGVLTGQKRGYSANAAESAHSYYNYQGHPQKSHSMGEVYPSDPNQFGVVPSGMNTGNFSPPMSMTPSEPHSPIQHQAHHSQDQLGDISSLQNTAASNRHSHGNLAQSMNPPNKRPRPVSRTMSVTADSPTPSSGDQWYGRDEGFDRSQSAASHHSMSASEGPGSGSLNYSVTSDNGNGNGMYYDNMSLAQQQQQQPKSFNITREEANLAGRPRFMPGTSQASMQYSASGPSSPQRSRSRLSSFQDSAVVAGAMAQQGAGSPFGRMQNSMSPDETKQPGYARPPSGLDGESNIQMIKVETVSGGFAHEATSWS
ncbi:hypothetical protein BCR41DRAFT_348720 [Lobosporangium transversale]|uniref:Uncharacterized protein n=1 Tax=Lobosporangium transversale TaxID=64571 RepID=A0A1Y2GV28_9FUNG|nr:hypothetical protein BCR41DRAFT_348720 [Lobosporangium transversale]ORZ24914.1 hypothetical protein BCR41DRAFT_348720 [Lobosporangium transversale]|eukprot:XP_021883895.1 hypothetical protein BCR41DRAFT_348720 [Lobosporangium transversale]